MRAHPHPPPEPDESKLEPKSNRPKKKGPRYRVERYWPKRWWFKPYWGQIGSTNTISEAEHLAAKPKREAIWKGTEIMVRIIDTETDIWWMAGGGDRP